MPVLNRKEIKAGTSIAHYEGIGANRDSNLFRLLPPDPELDLGLWLMNLVHNVI